MLSAAERGRETKERDWKGLEGIGRDWKVLKIKGLGGTLEDDPLEAVGRDGGGIGRKEKRRRVTVHQLSSLSVTFQSFPRHSRPSHSLSNAKFASPPLW